MSLFDIFKKKSSPSLTALKAEEKAIPENEKKYYQQDSYYREKSHENTMFEQQVISFDERKKTTIPSSRGLYVAEILLLHFCTKYPNPKNGYPSYWWYKYGIRDVDSYCQSLVQRGFIRLNDDKQKYELTEMGKAELKENEYVPYMHQHSKFTDFTVWDLNQILGTGDKSNYKEIVEKKHAEIAARNQQHHEDFMEKMKTADPDGYAKLKSQEDQLQMIQKAEEKFSTDNDIDWILAFWEEIWKNGGLTFRSSTWTFRLPDLYIQTKQYDKAISLCKRIKKETEYKEKADGYIAKIQTLKSKASKKK